MRTPLLALALLASGAIQAQIGTANEDRYAAYKGRTLLVQLKDTASAEGRKLATAIRSAWTFGPVSFAPLGVTDDRYADPNAFFATVEHDTRSMEFIHEFRSGTSRNIVNNDYFYIEFWSPAPEHKSQGRPADKERLTLGRAELYYKNIGTGKIGATAADLGKLSPDFCNGLPGYLKNYFQAVSSYLETGRTVRFKKDLQAQPGLAALQRDTLYVPNYWYGEGGTMLPEEAEGGAVGKYIRKMLDDYSYPIRLVRRDELSEMILNAKKPIYYVNYVQSSADKMVSVVNGLTGEVLYTNFTGKSYRPKGKDFGDIGRQVSGAK